jgi:hypothetical protein
MGRVWRFGLLAVASLIGVPAAADNPPPQTDAIEADDGEQGLVARFGSVVASFQFFGDVGARFRSHDADADGESRMAFGAGSFDFFTSVRLSDHLQTLSEVVAEFDGDSNEVGFELERLWASWSFSDALYVKLGREHDPMSRWNRRYHHGRIFWPAATQPFLARFEDQGGPLPIHLSGVEIGGRVHCAGTLGYFGIVSNGRGFERTEVTNVSDRDDSKAWELGSSFAPAAVPGLVFGASFHQDRIPADIIADPSAVDTRERIAAAFVELRAGRFEALGEVATIRHEAVDASASFDHRSWYLQANYHLTRLTPYVRADVRRMAQDDPFYAADDLDLDAWEGLAGMRLDLGGHAALKVEGGRGRGQTSGPSSAARSAPRISRWNGCSSHVASSQTGLHRRVLALGHRDGADPRRSRRQRAGGDRERGERVSRPDPAGAAGDLHARAAVLEGRQAHRPDPPRERDDREGAAAAPDLPPDRRRAAPELGPASVRR